MTKLRFTDLCTHVLIPLAVGVSFYFIIFVDGVSLPGSAYIPDALWAYAFFSSLLIVWDRQVRIAWLLTAALVTGLFEGMQYLHWISGTGDLVDILVYFISGGIAMITNKFLQSRYNQPFKHTTTK